MRNILIFFFSSGRRHTRLQGDWSSDVCSSDLISESGIRKVLDTVIDPATGRSVEALGMVSGVATRAGHVAITLDVDPARSEERRVGKECRQQWRQKYERKYTGTRHNKASNYIY